MAPINTEDCKRVITDDERKVLHTLLDKMCDEGQISMMWQTMEIADFYTIRKKRYCLHMHISDDIELQ